MTSHRWAAVTRLAGLFVAALLAVLVLVGALTVFASGEPTSCSFPNQLDNFQAVAPHSTWDAVMHNRLLCAINALERRVQSGSTEAVCVNATIPASTRQLVTITLAAPVTGTEPAFPSVIDPTNPARLEATVVQGLSGTTATVPVFNHDASNARTGRVCVSVTRT
jgi:hypothetical protein